jgi:AcrR family transcriptional regulator
MHAGELLRFGWVVESRRDVNSVYFNGHVDTVNLIGDDLPVNQRKPPTRDRYHHGALRPALVAAAVALVTEEGVRGVSLREVARRAGVSQAAPYRHFEDKDALVAAVAEDGFLRLRRYLASRRGDPVTRLSRIGDAYVAFALKHPAQFRLMFGPETADKARFPSLRAAGDATFAVLRDALAACQAARVVRDAPVDDLANAAWAVVHGVAALLLDGQLAAGAGGTRGGADAARTIGETLFWGLAPRA